LASSSEQPDSAHTLPRPELNPLLNPLLAENMGRWAEVYFTAPVEKREEAVLELLHELESEEETRGKTPPTPANVLNAVPDEEVRATMMASERASLTREHLMRCPSCGHENPVTHQFCGMCGATIESSASAVAAGASKEGAAVGSEVYSREAQSARAEEGHTPREEYYESDTNPHELSLFRSLRGRDGDYDLDYEPPASRPYRYYIGAVLAIVIAVLAYTAWRSEQAAQTRETPASPPAVTDTGAPSTAESGKQNTDTTAPPGAKNATPPQAETAAPTVKTPQPATTNAEPAKKEAVEKTAASAPATAVSSEQSALGNGSEELAMAQRYLSGGNGRARDSAEATKWLWKAIAKHNGEATLLLSDLYLKGDGVSKNCDQARVLLDSAARRGIAGAGERLRNLPAFGCQ